MLHVNIMQQDVENRALTQSEGKAENIAPSACIAETGAINSYTSKSLFKKTRHCQFDPIDPVSIEVGSKNQDKSIAEAGGEACQQEISEETVISTVAHGGVSEVDVCTRRSTEVHDLLRREDDYILKSNQNSSGSTGDDTIRDGKNTILRGSYKHREMLDDYARRVANATFYVMKPEVMVRDAVTTSNEAPKVLSITDTKDNSSAWRSIEGHDLLNELHESQEVNFNVDCPKYNVLITDILTKETKAIINRVVEIKKGQLERKIDAMVSEYFEEKLWEVADSLFHRYIDSDEQQLLLLKRSKKVASTNLSELILRNARMSQKELNEFFKIPRRQFEKMVKSGLVKSDKVGKTHFYFVVEVLNYFNGRYTY